MEPRGPVVSEEHLNAPVRCSAEMQSSVRCGPEDPGCKDSGIHGNHPDSPKIRFRWSLQERFSRQSSRTSRSRSRFQKLEVSSASRRLSVDASDKGSVTPAMRKKYLKELFLNNTSGLSGILSSEPPSLSSKECEDDDAVNSCASWALDPMEHAWMLSAVDGNYDTMVEFLAGDPSLLSRKDFISGYTALHWLAKHGQDDTLIRLLKYAEKEGLPVNVNLRGSGGLTPLHVAAMHNQHMIIKILVGAFGANVEVLDYSGKRAWQYLKDSAPHEMKELLGAWDDEHIVGHLNMNNNSASQAQSMDQTRQDNKAEVNSSGRGLTRWRFGSIRKLLHNVGLLEDIS